MDEDGLEVVRQWRPPERALNRLGLPAGTSAALPAWWALRRSDADVAQGWTAPAALACARSGKPAVYVFQGVLDERDLAGRPRVRSLLMRAARESDAVTAYSDVAAEAFTHITGIACQPIEPGIRLDAFTPADAAAAGCTGREAADRPGRGAGRHPAPAIFCAADPDEPRKRVRLLVDAFGRIRAERPDAELWLMNTRDESIRATPGVRLVDPGADRDALVGLYRSAWVSVLPAFREAFGLVVVESLACGTPVVGMRDGGAVPGIVGADAVANPDPEALADALLPHVERAPDAVTAAACRRRAEEYSVERCAARYEALYHELRAT